MRDTRVEDGVLGSFSFDQQRRHLPRAGGRAARRHGCSHEGAALDALYAGTAVDSIVEVPPGLDG